MALAGLLLQVGIFGLLGVLLAQQASQRVEQERLSIAMVTASFFDQAFEAEFRRLESFATRASTISDAPALQRQLLQQILDEEGPFVAQVFLIDAVGRLVGAEPPSAAEGIEASALRPHLLEPLGTGARHASGVLADGPSQQPMAVFSVPARASDGVVQGVLATVVEPSHIAVPLLAATALQLGSSGHGELIDGDGWVVAASEPEYGAGPGAHPDFSQQLSQRRVGMVGTTAPVGDGYPEISGQRHVMAYAPLASVPWGIGVGSSEAELRALADHWQWQTVLLGGFSVCIALVFFIVTTRFVTRPVRDLTLATQRIATGDLATPVPHVGQSEVRTLAVAFDSMRSRLRNSLDAEVVQEARYRGLVESMADAVVTTDAQLRIVAVNQAAAALGGWSTEALLGRSYRDLLRPTGPSIEAVGRDSVWPECGGRCGYAEVCELDAGGREASQPNVGQPLSQSLSQVHEPIGPVGNGHGPHMPCPWPARQKESARRVDGQTIVVATARSAIRDAHGALAGMVHVVRDVTAETKLEQLKEEFLATASHELRSPLGVIKGYASVLLLPGGPRDEKTITRALRAIVGASNKLEEFVGNVLDMSKIGAGMLDFAPRPVLLRPVARAAVERTRVRSPEHRIQLGVPADLPPVFADARRIEQVLCNLLDNAIRYSPDGGRIGLRAQAAGDEVVVSVTDEGIGIRAEELEMVFHRFFRGAAARDRRIAGSGLGLAICNGIVKAHGGRIWAESPAPRRQTAGSPGTVLRFTLPRAVGPAGPWPRSGSGSRPAARLGGFE